MALSKGPVRETLAGLLGSGELIRRKLPLVSVYVPPVPGDGENIPDIVIVPPVNCTKGSVVWLINVALAPVFPTIPRMRSVVEMVVCVALRAGPHNSAEAAKGVVVRTCD